MRGSPADALCSLRQMRWACEEPEWEQDYMDYSYSCQTIKIMAPVAALGLGLTALFRLYSATTSADGTGCDANIFTADTQAPLIVSSALSMVTCVVFCLPVLRGFAQRHYNLISSSHLLQIYVATLYSDTRMEMLRNNHATCSSGTGPLQVNSLLSGENFGKYISILSTPAMFRMDFVSSAWMCLGCCAAFAVANIIVQTPAMMWLVVMLFQLGVGVSTAYFAKQRQTAAREAFCSTRATRVSTEQTRNVLYTLLPREVLARLEAPGGHELLGTSREISACTVMFVHTSCIHPTQASKPLYHSAIAAHAEAINAKQLAGSGDKVVHAQAQFESLHHVFCTFDNLVEEAGMFKCKIILLPPPNITPCTHTHVWPLCVDGCRAVQREGLDATLGCL